MLERVTDEELLNRLNAMNVDSSQEVKDPDILKRLQQLHQPENVDTFIGQMPRHPKEFVIGSPEQKAQLEDLVMSAAGSPGFKIISQGLGRFAANAGNVLKENIVAARQDIKPFEQTLEKSSKAHELASLEANSVKPGLYDIPKTELENIENAIGSHLNIEGEHSVRASQGIKNRVKSIEDFWGNAYKGFEQKVKDAKFHMPEKAMESLSYDQSEVLKRLQQGADPKKVVQQMEKEKQNPFYDELLSNAPTSRDVNAGDFLAKYRDFRDALGGLKQDLKSERYGSVEKRRIREAIDKGKLMESDIKNVLHEGLGEFKPEFDWINKGYSEQVYPLRKNPLVKKAKSGTLPKNIMESLRTNESGMPLLRDMVKQDPELLKNIIGQRYKVKPQEIHAPNELVREYLNEMPELKELLTKKESSLSKYAQQKNITLAEKIKAEQQLMAIKKAKELANKNLKKSSYIGIGAGAAALGIPPLFGKLGKTFTQD